MTSISKPIMQLMAALTLVLGMAMATAQPAEARGGRGLAAGIVLGAVGAAIIASELRRERRHRRRHRRRLRRSYIQHNSYRPVSCYRGPERCGWVGHRQCWYNRYDERVCSGGHYRCWRERICR